MKNTFYTTTFFLSLFLVNGCGEKKIEKENVTPEKKTEPKTCMFALDNNSVIVNWTAFKLTDKAAVGGAFDSIIVSGIEDNENIIDAVVNTAFEIYTPSVNSSNPERDVKLSNSFFGTMNSAESISGAIVSLNKDGTGIVSIKMNGVEKDVDVNWKVSTENRFKLSTTINVPDWEAQASLDSLNNVCSLLHTGKDGVSVLWPDVEIEVIADFIKTCE